MEHPNKEIMGRAIELAKRAHKDFGFAVAAIIVKDDEIISEGYASVRKERDPTCHAEISAIRAATKKLDSAKLNGCYLYSTYEPCPMCTSAAVWAKMDGIVYGLSLEDRTEKLPWRIMISAADVIDKGIPKLELYPEFMRDQCCVLLSL